MTDKTDEQAWFNDALEALRTWNLDFRLHRHNAASMLGEDMRKAFADVDTLIERVCHQMTCDAPGCQQAGVYLYHGRVICASCRIEAVKDQPAST